MATDLLEFTFGESISDTYLLERVEEFTKNKEERGVLYQPRERKVVDNISLFNDEHLAYIKKKCQPILDFFCYSAPIDSTSIKPSAFTNSMTVVELESFIDFKKSNLLHQDWVLGDPDTLDI
jgi:hypothetical protein